MSYQVLARKWRPQQFKEMVGQRHVLKALVNALDNQRLHHAYLFTGTRGVGKTTLARLFAKSLNCEQGVSSTPCGVCGSCVELAENRFVDLIEVDAASRTKVEDTRELLDNVQYAPTRGRYKVYLIDEVHMLSNHSFNALLKTLEEPPPHVKFLLATTDPQKLPVTVLSRCLQFNLKSMTPEMVVEHLRDVLHGEQIAFEEGALLHLGKAAQGSMRDALSLTDQAVAFGQGSVRETEVAEMLGTVDTRKIVALVNALCAQNAHDVLQRVRELAEFSPDWQHMMADVLAVLHQMTILQLAPTYEVPAHGAELAALAGSVAPEDLQLYYQLGLQAHKDLAAAPEARQGFEMALLRMLAFTPDFNRVVKSPPAPPVAEPDHTTGVSDSAVTELADTAYPPQSDPTPSDSAPSNPAPSDLTPATIADAVEAPAPSAPVELDVAAEPVVPVEEDAGEAPPPWDPEPVAAETVEADLPSAVELLSDLEVASSSPATTTPDLAEPASDNSVQFHPDTLRALDAVSDDLDALQDHWLALIPALELSGVMANLVRHSAVHSCADGQIVLAVAPEYEPIYQVEYRHRVAESLQALDFPVEDVKIEFTDPGEETLHQREQRVRREAYRVARASLEQDAVVQTLIQELDGELLADTVEPSPGSQL